ncbi:MAG: GNAT family N-acetyltransferase [Phycisphaerales bacterium]
MPNELRAALFDPIELARAEETRLAAGFGELADETRPFAGGVMCRAAPGAWCNAAVGMGFAGGGPVRVEEVDELIAFYEGHAIEPRLEVAPYADISLTRALAERGFVVRNYENVLFRHLDGTRLPPTPYPPPRGLTIRAIDGSNEREVEVHARTATLGFQPPGTVIPDELLEIARRVARHPRVAAILAEIDGEVVGAGGLESHGPVAALFGVTVLPQARRKGVQRAMIEWRLNEAKRRGCQWATIGSRPGQSTERNVRRVGFELGYTKIVVVRPGAGLKPVTE